MIIDHEMCAYIEKGKQCEAPASIHVKQPCPKPHDDLMMEMWMCAEHYDLWCKEEGQHLVFREEDEEDLDATA
jgi:hypothetical protein